MTTDGSFYDHWQLPPDQPPPTGTADGPQLITATIMGVEPLDAQLGVFPKKTVPDALYEALFGQPAPTEAEISAAGGDTNAVPPLRTYAVLDAAKITNLPELLERSGLEHLCLFKGKAFEELKNVAPWIVALEPENNFTRLLFTDGDSEHYLWRVGTDLYIRSEVDLTTIAHHLRKFTRVQKEDGKFLYLRFFEAPFWSGVETSEASGIFLEIMGKIKQAIVISNFLDKRMATTIEITHA